MTTPPPMLDVRGLTKTYEDPDGGEVPALAGASWSCAAGQVYGLLGPNGAGKTTALRCLATILTPTAGGATVAGFDLVTQPEQVRQSIGFVSGTTGLYGRLTPRETVRFFGSLYGLAGDRLDERVEAVLRQFAVTEYADRPNDRLSTGMKQRVGLARAVVHDPPVVILDEPTSGLDPVVTRAVEESIAAIAAAGRCVILSTHMMSQAEDLCARIGVIGRGRVLGDGSVTELCAATGTDNLRQAFFALVDKAEHASDAVPTRAVSS